MAGHNKWSKVKHRKGAVDAKRSKLWTKIVREITVAAKMGGQDPNINPRLRKALEEAREANIPKDTLQRALTKASSKEESGDFEEVLYEGYGPNGVAVLVETLTDNRNRTSSDVRTAFGKNGGNLGTAGSVKFGFKKRGIFIFEGKESEEKLLEIGLDAGVFDVEKEDHQWLVKCPVEAYHLVETAYEKASIKPKNSELIMIPDNWVAVAGQAVHDLLDLVEALEDLDDVQKVWTNADLDEAEVQKWMNV